MTPRLGRAVSAQAKPRAPGGRALLSGTVQSIDGNTILVTTAGGTTYTVQSDATTVYQRYATAELEDIQVGMRISVTGTAKAEGVVATAVQITADGNP